MHSFLVLALASREGPAALLALVPVHPVLLAVLVSLRLNLVGLLLELLNSFIVFNSLLFRSRLVKVTQALDHGVNLLILLRHEHLLERSLHGQAERRQQVSLTPLLILSLLRVGNDLLLRFKR